MFSNNNKNTRQMKNYKNKSVIERKKENIIILRREREE